MLNPVETSQDDLTGGLSPWRARLARPHRLTLDCNLKCDVVVVGAGITGSLMADHLSSLGHSVCVIDRERPGFGSTVASTSMLQWEIDKSLMDLSDIYGFERAANIYIRSFRAVAGLKKLVKTMKSNCAFRNRHSLYLSKGEADTRKLLDEHALRERAGLPGVFLDHSNLLREFSIDREAAIVSPGCADADPLLLSHALISSAAARGAQIFDAEALHYESTSTRVHVQLENGFELEARHVVLATGYVMPDIVKTHLHRIASSWAIATPSQEPGRLWRDGVLIWEACEDYIYARTTIDNRIVIGGEDDDDIIESEQRDAMIPLKTELIQQKLQRLWPHVDTTAAFAWSGAFGQTKDGLPLIGPVGGHPGIYAAYGYGGNGITFSYLASRIIGQMIAGRHEPWFDDLAIDRLPY